MSKYSVGELLRRGVYIVFLFSNIWVFTAPMLGMVANCKLFDRDWYEISNF